MKVLSWWLFVRNYIVLSTLSYWSTAYVTVWRAKYWSALKCCVCACLPSTLSASCIVRIVAIRSCSVLCWGQQGLFSRKLTDSQCSKSADWWLVNSETVPNSKCGVFWIQVRGSIPLFWSQDSSFRNPRPNIVLYNNDPLYCATAHHFKVWTSDTCIM